MDRSSFLSENQKNNQLESNYKLSNLKQRQSSIEKFTIKNNINSKRSTFMNFLINKQSKSPNNNRKALSKEKSVISYTRASNLPPININIIKNSAKKSKQNLLFMNTYDIVQPSNNEKEDIISYLLSERNEKFIKENELLELKNKYKKLKDNNLTYKVIIEKILDLDEESDDDEENNNDEIYKEVKKINKKKGNGENIVNALKKQILDYDKSIKQKDKILEETKKEERITNFININNLLNEKNRELEKLVIGSQELQYFQNDMDNRVDFLNSSIKKYKENIYNLNQKIKLNKKEIEYNENEIKINIKERDDIKNKIEKLEKEKNKIEEDKLKKKELIKELNDEYETKQDIEKEKEKIENNIEDLSRQSIYIKKALEKNNTKILLLKKNNKELQNEMSIIDNEKKNRIDNMKLNIKNRENLKNYEKEIKEMKEEIEKNKKIEKELISKEEEENERIKKEIEEFEIAKINLINKINELNKELTEKTMLNTKKEEELAKKNKEYDNISKTH